MRNDFNGNYLMHWGIKKGGKKENHKYYERVEKNGKYLYFYTQAEYEAWLHKGNKALEDVKEKGKGLLDKAKSKLGSLAKDSNSRKTFGIMRQNLVNAVNVGYGQVTNLLVKAQRQLTSSNAQAVLDRGNKVISSTLGSSSKSADTKKESVVSKVAKKVKDTWDYDITGKGYVRNAHEGYKKAKEKFDNANKYENWSKRTDAENDKAWAEYRKAAADAEVNEKIQKSYYRNALIPRIKRSAENFKENTAYTISKGERKIAQMLRNTKDNAINALEKNANDRDHYYSMNTTLGKAYDQHGKAGSNVITAILATAAAVVVVTTAKAAIETFGPKIVEKTKELMDKIFNPEVKVTVETETKPAVPKEDQKQEPDKSTEQIPKDFSSDNPNSYKEDLAAHSDIPQKDTPTSKEEDMEAVNPNYKDISAAEEKRIQQLLSTWQALVANEDWEAADRIFDMYIDEYAQYEGYLQNCANCTLTYDMRRRGYDVTASWNPNATNLESITEWYKLQDGDILGYDTGGRTLSKQEIRQLEKAIKEQYPEGSYGHLMLSWTDGGGHDVVWSIENGEVVIRDCQNNQVVDFMEYAKYSNGFNMFRADDKELSDKAYAICTAEKANQYGDPDKDDTFDDDVNNFWRTEDNKVYDYQDVAYDYRKKQKAAGSKRK